MSLKKIITVPDETLRKNSEPIEKVGDNEKKLIPEINSSKANKLIEQKIISGGMIPKINNCLDVASNGVRGVVIIDGRKNHSLLFELLSDKGSGTLIRQ